MIQDDLTDKTLYFKPKHSSDNTMVWKSNERAKMTPPLEHDAFLLANEIGF